MRKTNELTRKDLKPTTDVEYGGRTEEKEKEHGAEAHQDQDDREPHKNCCSTECRIEDGAEIF